MTFYWWSHWFWITTSLPVVATLLLLLLPNAITHVHTYPNPSQQEITSTINSDTNLQHDDIGYNGSDDGSLSMDGGNNDGIEGDQHLRQQATGGGSQPAATTKLHQTTANLAWATSSPLSLTQNVMDLTKKPSVLSLSSIPSSSSSAEAAVSQSSIIFEKEHKRSADYVLDQAQANVPNGGNADDDDDDDEEDDNRNANRTPSAADLDAESSQAIAAHELNNYTTNLKSNSSTKTTNTTKSTTTTTLMPTTKVLSKSQSDGITKTVIQEKATTTVTPDSISGAAPPPPPPGAAAAPATPQIDIANNMKEGTANFNAEGEGDGINAIDSHISNDQHRAPFTLENVNAGEDLRRAEVEHRDRARKSKELSAEYKHINHYINFSSDTKSLLTRSASTAPNEFESDEGNISSEALAIQRTYFLDAGAISAICFTVFGICCTVGTIGIVLYRRRYLNKPQALSEPDSSVYIDDSTMRDNSDEMYSLDNDSFLNSLEAMTIQNYWTDTVKHTKL